MSQLPFTKLTLLSPTLLSLALLNSQRRKTGCPLPVSFAHQTDFINTEESPSMEAIQNLTSVNASCSIDTAAGASEEHISLAGPQYRPHHLLMQTSVPRGGATWEQRQFQRSSSRGRARSWFGHQGEAVTCDSHAVSALAAANILWGVALCSIFESLRGTAPTPHCGVGRIPGQSDLRISGTILASCMRL